MINFYKVSNRDKEGNKNGQTVPNSTEKKNFVRYTSAEEGLTGQELKRSLWFLRNKIRLYKILVGFLIGVNIIFWGYSLWQWGDYLIFGLSENARLSASAVRFINYEGFHPRVTATPLQVFSAEALTNSPGKVDLVADVANFNERFLATFDYYFIVNNQKTSPQKGFLLPGEENFLAFLGADEVVFSGVPELILENVRWLRISAHDIPDVSSWQKERLDFTTADFQFINRGSVADVTSYAIQFKLTNNSAYGFVNPKFYVALYQGQTLVGILPLEITKFLSGETRDVDLRSFTPNLNVTSMSVFPLVNIYDDSIFLAPGA